MTSQHIQQLIITLRVEPILTEEENTFLYRCLPAICHQFTHQEPAGYLVISDWFPSAQKSEVTG